MRVPLALLAALTLSLPRAAHAQPAPPAPSAQPARPVSLGLSGLIGSREAERGGSTPTWTAGLDAIVGLVPGVAVAFRRLTVGAARTVEGDRWAVGVSPALELHTALGPSVEPFVQVGAALQTRFGDGRQDVRFGVAPFVDAGMRFYLGPRVSLAAEVTLHAPLTGAFLFGHEILPQGAAVLQGGLALAFHLSR
ncbi:MAG: hypothetical protein U0325_06010 [Polyangiales bacterium]